MTHKRIGDRADDPRRAGAEMGVQDVFEIEDMRAAVRQRLIVHAVIGGQRDNAAEFGEAGEALVERLMKGERLGLVGGVAVLHVIRQRQIEELCPALLDEADAGIEHEQRQVGRIHIGLRPADQRLDRRDTVLLFRAAIRLFGREADAIVADRQTAAEHPAQLVFGGDRGHRHPGLRHQREERVAAQHRRIVHHDLGSGFAVEREIAGDSVHRRRRAGDERHVIGVGEGRHHGVGERVKAAVAPFGNSRQDAGGQPGFDIGGVAAIGADHHHRPAGQPIGSPIECNWVHMHARWIGTTRPSRRPLRGLLRMRFFLNAITNFPSS